MRSVVKLLHSRHGHIHTAILALIRSGVPLLTKWLLVAGDFSKDDIARQRIGGIAEIFEKFEDVVVIAINMFAIQKLEMEVARDSIFTEREIKMTSTYSPLARTPAIVQRG